MIIIEGGRTYTEPPCKKEELVYQLLAALSPKNTYDQMIKIEDCMYLMSSRYNLPFIKVNGTLDDYIFDLEEKIKSNSVIDYITEDSFVALDQNGASMFQESYEEYLRIKEEAETEHNLALAAKTAKDRNKHFANYTRLIKESHEKYDDYAMSIEEVPDIFDDEDDMIEYHNPRVYCQMKDNNIQTEIFKKRCKKKSKYNFKTLKEDIYNRKQ